MSNENGFFSPNLETAAIGRPITRAGISFFPVYLTGNDVPEIATGPAAERVIDELNDASVPDLTVTNPGKTPLLLIEGEQFIGGKQNRTVNISVLVAAGATLKIPVSCLEAGRWGRQRDFQSGRDQYAPPGTADDPRRGGRTGGNRVRAPRRPGRSLGQHRRVPSRDADVFANCGHCGRRPGFHSRPGPGGGGGRAGAARAATRTVRVCGDPRSADCRHRDFRRPRIAEAPLAGADPVLSARRADRERMAFGRPGVARAPGHQPGGVQRFIGPRPRPGAALHERERGRPGAHPRLRGRPRLGPQPVGVSGGIRTEGWGASCADLPRLVGREKLNHNVIHPTSSSDKFIRQGGSGLWLRINSCRLASTGP